MTKIESNPCNLSGVCSALLVFFHAWHPEGSSTSCLYVGHRWPEPHAGFRSHQSGSLGSSSFWYSLSELASQSSLEDYVPLVSAYLISIVYLGRTSTGLLNIEVSLLASIQSHILAYLWTYSHAVRVRK